MGTKFIGIDGYGEIKSVSQYKKNNKRIIKRNIIIKARKLMRFSKRLFAAILRDMKVVKSKFGDITWATLTPKKFFRGIRRFHIDGSYFQCLRTPKGIATLVAPVFAAAMLVLTVCFWTCSDKPLTVSLDGEYIATIESDEVLTQASAQMHSALSNTDTNEKSVAVIQVSYPKLSTVETATATDVYEKMVDCNEAIVADASGLYVDGVFYGATEDAEGLSAALTQLLIDAKANFDETTVTTFNNNVEVVTDVYATEDIKSAEELLSSATDSISIRLETDYYMEEEIPYSTITEEDDTQDTTYSEVKTEGVNGLKKDYYRLVYVDGVNVDALLQSSTTITEPVDEVVVVGTKESYAPSGDFMWPVPYTSNVTSHYKWRWGRQHAGLDIASNGCYGQAILASDAGTVEWAGYDNSGYGNYVIIDHGNGFKTLYGHCSDVYVSSGQQVKQGETIGAIGATGNVTGTHLHFEIWNNGSKVDPYPYVS